MTSPSATPKAAFIAVTMAREFTPRQSVYKSGEPTSGQPATGDCPSWDRTRTLLIQSQACCQLHQGARELLCSSPGNWLIPGTFEISRDTGSQQPYFHP